jgi:hypothetical protein
MVHGFFRASGIVMIYRLHHESAAEEVGWSVQNARVTSGEQRWVNSRERRSSEGHAAIDGMRRPALPDGMLLSSQWRYALEVQRSADHEEE